MENPKNHLSFLTVQERANVAGLFNKVFDAILSAQKADKRGDHKLRTEREVDIHRHNLKAMQTVYSALPEKESATCLRTINNLRNQILALELEGELQWNK